MRKSYRIPLAIVAFLAITAMTGLSVLIHTSVPGKEIGSAFDRTNFEQLKQRPLKLPTLATNERCPVSHGSKTMVPPVEYIFCSDCFWYSKGPVFLAMTWSDQTDDEARFRLSKKMPREGHFYLVKTPWVTPPDYSGPILIRGGRLNESSAGKLRFSASEQTTDALELEAPTRNRSDPSHWSFWPTYMFVPRPGCYGVQLDTTNATDVVVFEALPASQR
jgi:hypothetical protein